MSETPETAIIEKKFNLKYMKELKKANKASRTLFPKSSKTRQTVQNDSPSDDTSDEDTKMVLDYRSDDYESFELQELERQPVAGDYVLVRFPNSVFYVGKILTVRMKMVIFK